MFGVSRSVLSGETRTRLAGSVLRWGTTWIEKIRMLDDEGWENPTKCKATSKRRGVLITRLFLTRSSALLAIGDVA